MCIEIYLGLKSNATDLTVADSHAGFWSRKLAPGPRRVRALLELETVYEVGSFMGCTCGLSFGPWSEQNPEEEHDKRLENVREFANLLRQNSSTIQRIMTLEQYHLSTLAEFPLCSLDQHIDLAQLKEFSLDSDCVYELVP